MSSHTLTRRAVIASAGTAIATAALATPLATPANATDVCEIADVDETKGLAGLALAAVHIQRAVDAMAPVTFGHWQVTVQSGDADQCWCFKQITPHRQDRLETTIKAYRQGLADFNQNAPEGSNEAFEAYADITFRPPMEGMEAWTGPAPTLRSAVEAVRVAHDELRDCGNTDFILPMLAAAIAHFDANA